jgi:hypothetical protein
VQARGSVAVRARNSSGILMNTKPVSGLHISAESRSQLKLLLYAAASALLPYATATLLILFGQSQ